jgi:hypothetical protein
MADFINLTCPSCGGKLQLTSDIDRFACSYCGNELIVRRSGGIVSLAPVVEGLKGVKTGVDKTASELAINRLEGELSYLVQQRANASAIPLHVWIFGLGALLSFAAFWVNLSSGDASGIALLFFFIVGFVLLIVTKWQNDKHKREKLQNEAQINKSIEGKVREMQMHKAIVEGRN